MSAGRGNQSGFVTLARKNGVPTLSVNAIKLRYNLLIFNQILCVLGWGTRFFTFNKNNDLEPHPLYKNMARLLAI